MPQTLRLLRWVYVARLTLAAGIFGGALGVWRRAAPETTLLATLGLLLALLVTLGGIWYTEVLSRSPERDFLYGQVISDTVLVALVVHLMAANGTTIFSPLYILVITEGALLLPLPGGLLMGVLASLLYIADTVWFPVDLPARTAVLQTGLFVVIAMVTAVVGDRLRRTGRALGAVESELRQLRLDTNDILGAIDTGLVTVDGAGRLVYVNGSGKKLLSLDDGAWMNRPVLEELERLTPGLGKLIGHTLETHVPARRAEIVRRHPEGDRVIGIRTTLLEREGQPWVTAVFQDITEGKQVEELVRRTGRLQAVAELGASLAHEIKNPLASIRSAVEQLSGSRLRPQDRERLEGLALTESDRLSRLLSQFMEYSRVELRGRDEVDLSVVAAEAVQLVLEHPDASKGVRIDFAPPASPLLVDGDRDLLHRVVFNLVLNAVQHAGPEGVVTVMLERARELEMPASVPVEAPLRLRVTDTGPGIEQEDIPRLFDPFFTRRRGGTGLGLAMVHRAVEAHRGAILVDGKPGKGAEFTVYLPARAGRRS